MSEMAIIHLHLTPTLTTFILSHTVGQMMAPHFKSMERETRIKDFHQCSHLFFIFLLFFYYYQFKTNEWVSKDEGARHTVYHMLKWSSMCWWSDMPIRSWGDWTPYQCQVQFPEGLRS